MPVILPSLSIDSDRTLSRFFLPHQVNWIEAENAIHARHLQAFALAEKSVRIGWTYADAFKNVRKRLRFKKRDYLFATKDYESALEYVRQAHEFAEFYNFTRAIVSHGEERIKMARLDASGQPTGFMDETTVGFVKFDNGSRIIAFSAHPQAMAVYGGDVGLDEFAKHANARLLWETAQGRVTWGFDLAVWSAHDGEDTLFHQFAIEARSGVGPWNLYYRVTMPDAIELGLVELINRVQGTNLSRDQFLADCRARARSEEVYQQSYLCNPRGDDSASIVEWNAIERCRCDYEIERVHLEGTQVLEKFGQFNPSDQPGRESRIQSFLRSSFPALLGEQGEPPNRHRNYSSSYIYKGPRYRLGFDVAASGQGDLSTIYIDEVKGEHLWLKALFTCRTEDWHFLKTVLFFFLDNVPEIRGRGDESGLGRQICWEAAEMFRCNFEGVNFSSKKNDLGFALMNQLSVAEKRFPRSEQDIAADFFALRKVYTGTRWVFTEGRNTLNAASHCDIAWAAALASDAHREHIHDGCPIAFVVHDVHG